MGEHNYMNVELPSRCLPYGDEVNPEEIAIRPLIGEDEKILAELTTANFDKKTAAILGRVFKGVNPLDLTLGDRMFLLIWETINSYGSLYPLPIICPNCFRKVTIDIDLSKLKKKFLPEDFKQPHTVKLMDGSSVDLRLWTVRDEIEALNYENTGNSSWHYRYAQTIVSEEGIWDKIKKLESMDTKSTGLIRAFQNKYAHGLDMMYQYNCPKCDGGDELECPFRVDMLLPTGATIARSAGVEI